MKMMRFASPAATQLDWLPAAHRQGPGTSALQHGCRLPPSLPHQRHQPAACSATPAASSSASFVPYPAPQQREGGLLSQLREALGDTGGDPGHWNLSPQWWGTQGGGWGRDEGTTVFSARSECGNGQVTVTSHECTPPASAPAPQQQQWQQRQQWRVLRFNDVTRQSVNLVEFVTAVKLATDLEQQDGSSGSSSSGGGSSGSGAARTAAAQRASSPLSKSSSSSGGGSPRPGGASAAAVRAVPWCLGFPYLKTMASLAAALHQLQDQIPAAAAITATTSNSSSSNNASVANSSGSSISGSRGGDGPQPPIQQQAGRSPPPPSSSSSPPPPPPPYRVLCVGLGGGSLPLFLAACYQQPEAGGTRGGCWEVTAAELDPVVVEAATSAMGLPTDWTNLSLHTGDACELVGRHAAALSTAPTPSPSSSSADEAPGGSGAVSSSSGDASSSSDASIIISSGDASSSSSQYYDLVIIDAFDGEDRVPDALISPGSPFLSHLRQVLHPCHGAAMINMHGGGGGGGRSLWGSSIGSGCGYDPRSELGRRVDEAAAALTRAVLLGADVAHEYAETAPRTGSSSSSSVTTSSSTSGSVTSGSSTSSSRTSSSSTGGCTAPGGTAFTVSTAKQDNIIVVAARGVRLPKGAREAAGALRDAAAVGAAKGGYPFPAGSRACQGLQLLSF